MIAALLEIVGALGAMVEVGAACLAVLAIIEIIFDPKGAQKTGWLVGNIVSGAFKVATFVLDDVELKLQPVATAFVTAIERTGGPLLDDLTSPFGKVAALAFKAVKTNLESKRNIQPADWEDIAKTAMQDAFGWGLAAHAVTAGFEAMFPEKLNCFNGMGPMLATLAGFEEVTRNALGPLLHSGIGIPAAYDADSKFRPKLPDLKVASEMHARGVIDDVAWQLLAAYNGLNPDYTDPVAVSAHRAAQPFQLLRGLGLIAVDLAPAMSAMRFAGFRSDDIDALIASGKRQGLNPLVSRVVSKYSAMAGKGLMSDSDLTNQLQALNLTSEAINLILSEVHVDQLVNLAEGFKRELDIEVGDGQIDLTDYQNALLSVGWDQKHVDVFAGTASVKLEKAVLTAEARAAATEARTARQLAVRTSLAEFRKGTIDAALLAAALIAAGVSPAVAAGYTALASVERTPNVRLGDTLSQFAQGQADQRSQARTAEEQYKKALIDEPTLRAQLASAGMSPAEIDYEVTYLNALVTKRH